MEVLFREQDRQALRLEIEDGLRHLLDDDGCETLGRLVEQHGRWVAHQRARDGQHLLFPSAHQATEPVAHRREVRKQREKLVVRPFRRILAPGLATDLEVLGDGQAGEHPSVLGYVSQSETADLERFQSLYRLPLEGDLALRGSNQADDRLDRRRLACAVAAEQRHDLASTNLERNVGQDLRPTVEGVDTGQLEDLRALRRGHESSTPCTAPLPK